MRIEQATWVLQANRRRVYYLSGGSPNCAWKNYLWDCLPCQDLWNMFVCQNNPGLQWGRKNILGLKIPPKLSEKVQIYPRCWTSVHLQWYQKVTTAEYIFKMITQMRGLTEGTHHKHCSYQVREGKAQTVKARPIMQQYQDVCTAKPWGWDPTATPSQILRWFFYEAKEAPSFPRIRQRHCLGFAHVKRHLQEMMAQGYHYLHAGPLLEGLEKPF